MPGCPEPRGRRLPSEVRWRACLLGALLGPQAGRGLAQHPTPVPGVTAAWGGGGWRGGPRGWGLLSAELLLPTPHPAPSCWTVLQWSAALTQPPSAPGAGPGAESTRRRPSCLPLHEALSNPPGRPRAPAEGARRTGSRSHGSGLADRHPRVSRVPSEQHGKPRPCAAGVGENVAITLWSAVLRRFYPQGAIGHVRRCFCSWHLEWGVSGIWWVEARDAAKRAGVPRTPPRRATEPGESTLR